MDEQITLTQRQFAVLSFMQEYHQANSIYPDKRLIAKVMWERGVLVKDDPKSKTPPSVELIHRVMVDLEAMGLIRKVPKMHHGSFVSPKGKEYLRAWQQNAETQKSHARLK